MAGFALGIFFLFFLYLYYLFENRRRDKKYGVPSLAVDAEEDLMEENLTMSDRQIHSFRYVR
jgi:hypothetical protein